MLHKGMSRQWALKNVLVVGELGKNITPSKLRRCRDFDEFLKAVEKEPSNISSFMISDEFSNPTLLGEIIAERARIRVSVHYFRMIKTSEIIADLGNSGNGSFENLRRNRETLFRE
jgi:hypothetical protein